MEFGDEVFVDIRDGRGADTEVCLVIGTPIYAANRDIIMVATDKAFGMPVNEMWCTPTGHTDAALAQKLRERYEARFPDRLASLPEPTP